jgi:hypothetical protein
LKLTSKYKRILVHNDLRTYRFIGPMGTIIEGEMYLPKMSRKFSNIFTNSVGSLMVINYANSGKKNATSKEIFQ